MSVKEVDQRSHEECRHDRSKSGDLSKDRSDDNTDAVCKNTDEFERCDVTKHFELALTQ